MQMWVSFDSEFNADHEYPNMLADLMPLSVMIPTDNHREENNFKFNSQGIGGIYGTPDFEKRGLYRVIPDITRIPSLVSIFILFDFRKIALLLMQYVHYRGWPQGRKTTAGHS